MLELIRRQLFPPPRSTLRVFFIGGFWMGKSDVVFQMYDALRELAVVTLFNTDEHREALDCEGRAHDYGFDGPVFIRLEKVERRIRRFRPDVIVCCAGGLSFRPEDLPRLAPCRLVGIALSDPDVFPKTTSRIARNFSQFHTNSAQSIEDYRRLGVEATLLPFAANPRFHRKMSPDRSMQTDLLFIGNYRSDRVDLLRQLENRHRLAVYGEGWEQCGIRSRGHIEGRAMVRAINSATICLDFPRTLAGHDNVKVRLFEYGCCGALVLTGRLEEIGRYFVYDSEIIGYSSTAELLHKIDHYLTHPEEAERVRTAMRARCLRDHTWQQRWADVLPVQAHRAGTPQ